MAHVIFDTLAFVKKLKQSDFTEAQAEALSEAFKDAQKTALEDLATKRDLKELEAATKADIQELRQVTKADIQELRQVTKADIQELRQVTKADIQELKSDVREFKLEVEGQITLIKWMLGFVLAGILSIMLKTFFA